MGRAVKSVDHWRVGIIWENVDNVTQIINGLGYKDVALGEKKNETVHMWQGK